MSASILPAVPHDHAAGAGENVFDDAAIATLDACAGWLNLVGRVVAAVPGAKIVRLQ